MCVCVPPLGQGKRKNLRKKQNNYSTCQLREPEEQARAATETGTAWPAPAQKRDSDQEHRRVLNENTGQGDQAASELRRTWRLGTVDRPQQAFGRRSGSSTRGVAQSTEEEEEEGRRRVVISQAMVPPRAFQPGMCTRQYSRVLVATSRRTLLGFPRTKSVVPPTGRGDTVELEDMMREE